MKHINQLAQQLQVSTEIVRNICQLLDLEISGNTVSEQVESQLSNLKTVAHKENMSLEEAAQHLVEMRNSSEEMDGRKFNKREYIKQRFGVDPEQASGDSFVGMLYGDTDRGIQLGQLRHRVVLESSTLALEEFIFSGTGDNLNEFDQAQERINSRIDNDFFGKVNWGDETHPLLLSTSTPQQKQLKSSRASNKAISEEIVNQMLPICYQFRDESLLQIRNNATVAVGINFLSVLAGTVIGTWVAIPPTQERREISSIQPILIGVGIGEVIGLILALIIIWKSKNNERSM